MDDLFAGAAFRQLEGAAMLVSHGREYRSLETAKGIGVAWFGPGETQGVIGCYYPNNAEAMAAVEHIESKRAAT